MCTAIYALKSTYNKSFEYFLILLTPDLELDLLKSIFETLLEKLSSEIYIIFLLLSETISASEQVRVGIWCLKYQKLFKTLFISIFQGMYCSANKTTTLSPIQHTVIESA